MMWSGGRTSDCRCLRSVSDTVTEDPPHNAQVSYECFLSGSDQQERVPQSEQVCRVATLCLSKEQTVSEDRAFQMIHM